MNWSNWCSVSWLCQELWCPQVLGSLRGRGLVHRTSWHLQPLGARGAWFHFHVLGDFGLHRRPGLLAGLVASAEGARFGWNVAWDAWWEQGRDAQGCCPGHMAVPQG